MIDFTSCRVIPGRAYNGANGNKIAVEYAGEMYMLKFPPSAQGKPTELSYTNSCISEHIASSVYNMLGIPAQETMLGTFTVKDKQKIVCACKDFTAGGKRLLDFCSIKNTVLDSDSNGNGTELADILDTIDKQQFVSPPLLRAHFWDMFVADALLGNFDRHNGNWGFLYDDQSGRAQIAPVFDCGSCLLPQADDNAMQKVLDSETELHARIFQFPTSAIKLHGRKINYYDFLTGAGTAATYPDCAAAVKRIVPQIDVEQITQFIQQIPSLSARQKQFYTRYVTARHDLLIRPALDIAMTAERQHEGPQQEEPQQEGPTLTM